MSFIETFWRWWAIFLPDIVLFSIFGRATEFGRQNWQLIKYDVLSLHIPISLFLWGCREQKKSHWASASMSIHFRALPHVSDAIEKIWYRFNRGRKTFENSLFSTVPWFPSADMNFIKIPHIDGICIGKSPCFFQILCSGSKLDWKILQTSEGTVNLAIFVKCN